MKKLVSFFLGAFIHLCSDSNTVDISSHTKAVQQLSAFMSQEERNCFFVSFIVPRTVFSYHNMNCQAPSQDAGVILDHINRRYALERDLSSMLGVKPSPELLKFVNERHFGTVDDYLFTCSATSQITETTLLSVFLYQFNCLLRRI